MTKNIWVISDTHFNHANILNFTDSTTGNLIRPGFSSVKEMDEHMIDCWNSVVKQGDKVYHLGDVVLGNNSEDWMKANWTKLHGSKRLIVGNHDNIKMLSKGGFFAKVQLWRVFSEFGLQLTHVPIHSSNLRALKNAAGETQKTFTNIHGHIHQNTSPMGPYRNMSVEAINYTPVNIEELRIY